MRNSWLRERGEVAVEYVVAGVALIALIGGVLATTSVGTYVSQSFGYVFCEAAAVVDGRTCAPPSFTDSSSIDTSMEELSPEEQAYAGDYVALGDSYSSGEGADDYIDGTNDDNHYTKWAADKLWGWNAVFGTPNNNICRRSENAYSAHVYSQGDFNGEYIFGACSGAITTNYFEDNNKDNDGEGPQREHITKDTSLITLSMGGNDFGFSDIMSDCVISGITTSAAKCGSEESTQAAYASVDAKVDELVTMYQQMGEDAPDDARILIVGYPRMFPDPPTGPTWGMSINSQRWINDELLGYANDTVQRAMADSGVDNLEFVDVSESLDGHEAGTSEPWMHDLKPGFDGDSKIPVSNNSYHPTSEGQNAIGAIVQDAVVNGGEKP